MSDVTTAGPGHNNPPIIPPTDVDMLADLQKRYPELAKEQEEFATALATFPTEFTLKDEETAAALQDLMGKMKKHQSVLAAHKKTEKKPWDTLVKVVQNFFVKHDEKIDTWLAEWQPRHQAFLELKKEDTARKAEEEAARLREVEEKARTAAAEKAEDALWAEARMELAEYDERKAREREADLREDQMWAEARTELAQFEERRIAREKTARERAEKEQNGENLKAIRRHMKDVEKLNTLADADEANEDQIAQLDAFIRPGGVVSALAGPVASSTLLDEEQKVEVEELRLRLDALRTALNSRYDAKEQRKRAKALQEEQARQAVAAENRMWDDAYAELALYDARKATEQSSAKADQVKSDARDAVLDVRDARTAGTAAAKAGKQAAKDLKTLGADADRAANRADRIEDRLENSTDADLSRTRGDLGTVGSLTRSWKYRVVDRDALRGACGVLGPHLTDDAMDGAVFRWMRLNQADFKGERAEGLLAGVVFVYEQGERIA